MKCGANALRRHWGGEGAVCGRREIASSKVALERKGREKKEDGLAMRGDRCRRLARVELYSYCCLMVAMVVLLLLAPQREPTA